MKNKKLMLSSLFLIVILFNGCLLDAKTSFFSFNSEKEKKEAKYKSNKKQTEAPKNDTQEEDYDSEIKYLAFDHIRDHKLGYGFSFVALIGSIGYLYYFLSTDGSINSKEEENNKIFDIRYGNAVDELERMKADRNNK